MDINELMKAAQGLRTQLENAKEQAEKLRVTGEAGGGMVRVVMNGRYEVVELTIEPAAVSDDIKLVEDLTRAAVNQASSKVGEQLQGSLGSMAQGLGVDLELTDDAKASLEALGYGGGTTGKSEGRWWSPDVDAEWNQRFE